jgi:hypothetical protein
MFVSFKAPSPHLAAAGPAASNRGTAGPTASKRGAIADQAARDAIQARRTQPPLAGRCL